MYVEGPKMYAEGPGTESHDCEAGGEPHSVRGRSEEGEQERCTTSVRCTQKVRDQGSIRDRIEASDTLLAGIIREKGLYRAIYPNTLRNDVNPDLGPEDPELLNGLLDVLFEPAWIAVVLRKLIAKASPRDHSFTLCTVAAIDKKGE